MLFIDYDILDAYVAEPGFSIPGSVADLPLTKSGTINEGCWRTPDATALIVEPMQLTDGWKDVPKFGLNEYSTDGISWEAVARRGPVDTFLHSTSSVTGPAALLYSFPRNVGFFVEGWFYSLADTPAYRLFDMSFGGHFALFVHSDGTAELLDTTTSTVIGQGAISPHPVTGKFVRIGILPYRRNRILVWSDQGGWFSAVVPSAYVDYSKAASADASPNEPGVYVITEAGPVSLYNQAVPAAATFCLSPLMYSADGGFLLTQVYQSRNPLPASGVTIALVQGDQEMHATISYEGITGGAADGSTTTYQYSIILSAQNGVAGIGDLEGNPAIPGMLYTAKNYMNRVDCPRELGTRQYTTNTITTAIAAEMHVDKDRNKSTFSFLLDNPFDMWTSLKDLENRRVKVYLDLAEYHGLPADLNDPDRSFLMQGGTDYAGPMTVFEGYGELPQFVDGTESRIKITCVGMIAKLRRKLMSSEKDYDGVAHTEAVREVLMSAGFVDASDNSGHSGDSSPFGNIQILIYDDGLNAPLTAGEFGGDSSWRPRDGATAEEFLNEIVAWSGWDLFEAQGIWYYQPKGIDTATSLSEYGVIEIGRVNWLLSETGGTNMQSAPNTNPTYLAALSMEQTGEQLTANDLYVLGVDADGNSVVAHYADQASMSDRTATNYVGDRWIFVLENSALMTQEAVTTVCAALAQRLPYPTRMVEFVLPDWRPELPINAPVNLDGYGPALITGIQCSFGDEYAETGARHRRTTYLAELQEGLPNPAPAG